MGVKYPFGVVPVFVVPVWAFLAGNVHAETDTDPDFGIGLLELSDVVVEGEKEETRRFRTEDSNAALKINLSAKELPQSISTISSEQLTQFDLSDVNQALEYSSGVNVQRVETERTYFTARGYNITNFQYDGVGLPLTDGLLRGGIDTAMFDRIEVLSGANGITSAYGDPSATVNFVRKKPQDAFGGDLSFCVGSWNQLRLQADITGTLTEGLRGRAVAVGESADSYLDRYHRDTGLFYGVVDYDFSPDTVLTLGASQQAQKTDSPSWGALPIVYSDGTPTDYLRATNTGPEWAYTHNDTQMLFAELTHYLSYTWEAHVQIQQFTTDTDSRLFFFTTTEDRVSGDGLRGRGSAYQATTEQSVFDLYAQGYLTLGHRDLQLVTGAQLSRSITDDVSTASELGEVAVESLRTWDGDIQEPEFTGGSSGRDLEQMLFSLYSTARLDVTEELLVTAGLRLMNLDTQGESYSEEVDTQIENEVVPYLGVVYNLTDALAAYASATKIFSPQETDKVTQGGQLLEPESGDAYEVGFKLDLFNKAALASAGLFKTEKTNVAEIAGISDETGRPYYRAGEEYFSQGYELQLSGMVSPTVAINTSYTHVKITNKDDEQIRTFNPENTFRLTSLYTSDTGIGLGFSLRWQDEIEARSVNQGAYTLIDAMASYEVFDNITLRANATNIADSKYYTSFYWAADNNQAFYGPGAAYSASVTWDF